ncbi:MAG: WYL domain-containing protein [Lachnospiraceae bacterium]|jgi:predicted DNA-binding transcriptional regulator YafY|nr:WYL domain-containing protein [Lachnospiraceae bacterium]
MARAANQKLKVLYILKLLEQSDETHVVTMREILGELAAHGIQAERKRIYDDLDALRRFGYPVAARKGRMAGYYLEKEGREGLPRTGPCPGDEENAEKIGLPSSPSEGEINPDTLPEWLVLGELKTALVCEEETSALIWKELGGERFVRMKSGKKAGSRTLKFKIKPGGEFYGWLARFGCQVRLSGPPELIKEYKRYLKEIRNMYKEG